MRLFWLFLTTVHYGRWEKHRQGEKSSWCRCCCFRHKSLTREHHLPAMPGSIKRHPEMSSKDKNCILWHCSRQQKSTGIWDFDTWLTLLLANPTFTTRDACSSTTTASAPRPGYLRQNAFIAENPLFSFSTTHKVGFSSRIRSTFSVKYVEERGQHDPLF